jgi:hypothetical protein
MTFGNGSGDPFLEIGMHLQAAEFVSFCSPARVVVVGAPRSPPPGKRRSGGNASDPASRAGSVVAKARVRNSLRAEQSTHENPDFAELSELAAASTYVGDLLWSWP